MMMSDRTAEGPGLLDDVSNYDDTAYKKPSVTVDMAICTIMDNELKVLLIKRKYPPFRDHWAIPGGFVDIDREESLDETAMRELKEETHVENVYLEQLKTYGDPGRDPRTRVITVSYFALLPEEFIDMDKVQADDDAKEYQWFALTNLPEDMAFDHRVILFDLLVRIQGKVSYTSIAFNLVPQKFTWQELQNVYEIILGEKLLRANFRRKIRSMYKIKELKTKKKGNRGRPSILLKYEGIKEFARS